MVRFGEERTLGFGEQYIFMCTVPYATGGCLSKILRPLLHASDKKTRICGNPARASLLSSRHPLPALSFDLFCPGCSSGGVGAGLRYEAGARRTSQKKAERLPGSSPFLVPTGRGTAYLRLSPSVLSINESFNVWGSGRGRGRGGAVLRIDFARIG